MEFIGLKDKGSACKTQVQDQIDIRYSRLYVQYGTLCVWFAQLMELRGQI